MTNHPLRTIFFGVGGRGKTWVQTLCGLPELFEPVALVDVDQNALREAVEWTGIDPDSSFRDHAEALSTVEADVCCIATPSAYHVKLAELCMDAGLHVLVEQPLANSWDAAIRVVRHAEESQRRLVVAPPQRFAATHRTIADLVRRKALGEPGYVQITRHHRRPQPGSWTNDYPLLLEVACRDFDALLSLFRGRRVISVLCKTFSPLWSDYPGAAAAHVLLEFEGGIEVNYAGFLNSATDSYRFRLECSHGAIISDGETVTVVSSESDEQPVDLPALEESPEVTVAREFYRFVVDGREPEVSARNYLRTMQLVCGCMEASRTKKVVKLTV